jgi:NDP-sugar pyrophosphorylase family protein
VAEPVLGLVLAGGQGTRMRSSRPAVPKPLVEVGGVPLLEFALRRLCAAGVREVYVALRHEADRIAEFLARLRPSLLLDRLETIREEQPLGTIGAAYFLRAERRTVLAVNADLISAIDLALLLRHHREREAHFTIATHDEHHRLKLGEVMVAGDGRVIDYLEKPVKSWRISSGTYALEHDVLQLIERPEWLAFPALARRALEADLRVREEYHTEPWIDVNDAADLERANELVAADPTAFGLEPRARGALELP